MRFLLAFFTLFIMCNMSYAGDGHAIDIAKTDIIERTINFVIFLALMWYMVADKIRGMLRKRSEDIEDRLTKTQTRVKESRERREKAERRLKEAQERAKEIIDTARKEAHSSVLHIEEKTKEQIATLIRSNEEAMIFQEKVLFKEIVAEVLQEKLLDSSVSLSSNDYTDILMKKVA